MQGSPVFSFCLLASTSCLGRLPQGYVFKDLVFYQGMQRP